MTAGESTSRASAANTDFCLHRAEPPDEVDFQQPSSNGFKAISPGAPVSLRLGAPHEASVGFSSTRWFSARASRDGDGRRQ
jgi:hypothetical protein